ncbi:1,2-diacylglycerol-3-alpha-glucose alpha-1,2-glucosyltransferase [Oribacterium sp. KHPX15]|nr:1,2-diacylglycerol-3-alpha-glucose alpha-1,2-glucosyltransferase [Oribacterium sp. KHPX15]
MMHDNNMKTFVYMGGINLTKKSGVGKAVYHQISMLEKQGISVNKSGLKQSDIVHINTVFPDSVFMAVRAKALGKKVLYYGHSTMEDFKNSFVGSNFLAPVFKQWIVFCYGLGDAVITPTEYSKSLLEGYNIKKPVYALSNGIDTYYWRKEKELNLIQKKEFLKKYNLPDDKKVIMSVGHYMERKGITEFIELARNNPDYSFIWFGYTPSVLVPARVRKEIRQSPENLIFAGFVDSAELKKAYNFCDLFLFMSHEETEGIVVLEAMACEIPVIVRDIPVYNGWLVNGKNVFKFKQNDELPGILKQVLNSTDKSIVKEAGKTALERDFSRTGQRLSAIYDIIKAI